MTLTFSPYAFLTKGSGFPQSLFLTIGDDGCKGIRCRLAICSCLHDCRFAMAVPHKRLNLTPHLNRSTVALRIARDATSGKQPRKELSC